MEFQLDNKTVHWAIKKIAVIGPGIVGMPMAALLADACIKIGSDQPARVVVVQRNSLNSGWKVDAINSGKSVIGGIEPDLDTIVKRSVEAGRLSATHDYSQLSDADVILISVQTDKKGIEPDYGPLFEALTEVAKALINKPAENVPLVIFESTLAPSSMMTLIESHFAKYGLYEGNDILLGNSPNRVMPGRLVDRVKSSDKLVGGLHPITPQLIHLIYSNIVTSGKIYETNSLTAEIVKTLENAYRDVRIAFSSEIVSYCDQLNIDYYLLRDKVNDQLQQQDSASKDPISVPTGGLLIPNIGVGGHCLPKDGVLLWWRMRTLVEESSRSLILKSREINNASPAKAIHLAEKKFGKLDHSKIAVLGAAYRFNSEDTRNSPSLVLSKLLQEKGCQVNIHDPYVKSDDQNLLEYKLDSSFSNKFEDSIRGVDYIFLCTSHQYYIDHFKNIFAANSNLKGVFDGCNLYHSKLISEIPCTYTGIGRGQQTPDEDFVRFVFESFRILEKGIANELVSLIDFFNKNYAKSTFNQVAFKTMQMLARTCSTGCLIADPGNIEDIPRYEDFSSELASLAYHSFNISNPLNDE